MKKALSICLFLSLMAGCLLTGCDRTSTANSSSVAETTAATTATEAVTEAETTAEESEDEETEAETETTAEESADAEDAETTTAAKEKDTSKDGNLWADFDNMSFKINGKTYTLGKTTLQEMIDDGVPFDENDLANAGNNINPRYESSSFEIKLGERSFAQVRVLNDSSDNKKASECFIDNVYMPIYDEPQDILEFNFPLTMTQEELLANSGEPDPDNIYTYQSDDSDYHSESYTYEKEAEKYYGNSSYKFEFANDVLAYVTISYTP